MSVGIRICERVSYDGDAKEVWWRASGGVSGGKAKIIFNCKQCEDLYAALKFTRSLLGFGRGDIYEFRSQNGGTLAWSAETPPSIRGTFPARDLRRMRRIAHRAFGRGARPRRTFRSKRRPLVEGVKFAYRCTFPVWVKAAVCFSSFAKNIDSLMSFWYMENFGHCL